MNGTQSQKAWSKSYQYAGSTRFWKKLNIRIAQKTNIKMTDPALSSIILNAALNTKKKNMQQLFQSEIYPTER